MSANRGALIVTFLILVAVVVSAIGMLAIASFSTPPTTVSANSALYVKLEAPFNEVESSDLLSQFRTQSPTLRATIDAIHRAKTDTRIAALVIRPEAAGPLWAQIEEVRGALADFKTSGKPVIAFLEAAGTGEYYIASVADRVVMMPAGQLDVSGIASYEVFFRGALDKLGVFPDLLHIGEYKTASNTFAEKTFTPAHREMTQALNKDWYDEFVRGIAGGRRMSEDAARLMVDDGPYLADGAAKAKLVDEVAYEDQLDDKAPLQGTTRIDAGDYEKAAPFVLPADSGGRIALLYAVGTVASGPSSFGGASGDVLGSETFSEWLRKVRVDSSIRAVVIRIDSPGGSAIASEVIWREVMLTRDVKPVVVSMGDVAASGGYYIAAPAHAIVAEPGTLTGSIGVVTGKFVVQGALDKLGVGTGSASNGRFAEMNSPFRPFTADERARVEEQMQTTYELFLKRVADGRREPVARVDAVAQGRVWTGRQARERGLVDELGGLDDAIRLAKERAKIDPSKRVDLVVYPQKRSFYQVLANPFGSADTETTGLELLLSRPDARMVQAAASMVRLFRRGEPLAIMPNVFVQ